MAALSLPTDEAYLWSYISTLPASSFKLEKHQYKRISGDKYWALSTSVTHPVQKPVVEFFEQTETSTGIVTYLYTNAVDRKTKVRLVTTCSEKLWPCLDCGVQCTLKNSLMRHCWEIHHHEPPDFCVNCDRTLSHGRPERFRDPGGPCGPCRKHEGGKHIPVNSKAGFLLKNVHTKLWSCGYCSKQCFEDPTTAINHHYGHTQNKGHESLCWSWSRYMQGLLHHKSTIKHWHDLVGDCGLDAGSDCRCDARLELTWSDEDIQQLIQGLGWILYDLDRSDEYAKQLVQDAWSRLQTTSHVAGVGLDPVSPSTHALSVPTTYYGIKNPNQVMAEKILPQFNANIFPDGAEPSNSKAPFLVSLPASSQGLYPHSNNGKVESVRMTTVSEDGASNSYAPDFRLYRQDLTPGARFSYTQSGMLDTQSSTTFVPGGEERGISWTDCPSATLSRPTAVSSLRNDGNANTRSSMVSRPSQATEDQVQFESSSYNATTVREPVFYPIKYPPSLIEYHTPGGHEVVDLRGISPRISNPGDQPNQSPNNIVGMPAEGMSDHSLLDFNKSPQQYAYEGNAYPEHLTSRMSDINANLSNEELSSTASFRDQSFRPPFPEAPSTFDFGRTQDYDAYPPNPEYLEPNTSSSFQNFLVEDASLFYNGESRHNRRPTRTTDKGKDRRTHDDR
ncbi:hypothetical protein MMC25_002228 [Agyrium rufum]|nr:hypothetical protein [Agyrium rufum]